MYSAMLRSGTGRGNGGRSLGQWGITQDDDGRFFYTRNSDQLRGDLFSPHYGVRTRRFPNLPALTSRWPEISASGRSVRRPA